MNDYTWQLLREVGNAPHDDYVAAYNEELNKSCNELYELRSLITSPWYDRFLTQSRIKELSVSIPKRWRCLQVCQDIINWDKVTDQALVESARILEDYHYRLSSYPLIAKMFTA